MSDKLREIADRLQAFLDLSDSQRDEALSALQQARDLGRAGLPELGNFDTPLQADFDALKATDLELDRDRLRLREENERLKGTLATEEAERIRCRDGWAAERERVRVLREALKRYVDEDEPCEYGGGDECPGTPAFTPCRLHQGRAALRSPEEPKPESCCICPGCVVLVPKEWSSGLCRACFSEDCEHEELKPEKASE